MHKSWIGAATAMLVSLGTPALAQHADENAARAAGDAFGTNIGTEKVGLYTPMDVRGFNPATAGNLRLEGLYFDFRLPPPPHLPAGSQVRVGLTAQAYPFPAPTGIIDYSLRPVGDTPYLSTLAQIGPNGGYDLEVDGGAFIKPHRFGIALGFNIKRDEDLPRDSFNSVGVAFSPRWRPNEAIEVRPYFGLFVRPSKKAAALVFAAGPELPKEPKAQSYDPDWSTEKFHGFSTGVLGSARLSPAWTFHSGFMVFHVLDEGLISDSYLNTDANGLAATRRFTNPPAFHSNSTSGESRLTGTFGGDRFQHVVQLSIRARDVDRTYGGSAQVNLPNVQIGQFNAPLTEPVWNFGVQSDELIRQWTGGASYLLAKRGLGNIGVGVQKIAYRKTVETPGRPNSVTRDKPLFWNGSASLTPTPRLALYAAFTAGLEEAPVAPEIATNAAEAPPAIHTKQHEFGARYIVTPRLRLVLGYFNVQKPYFNLDGLRTWRQLGIESHKGIEASLTGEIYPGLNVVAGYVHMTPKVVGEAVSTGLIGPVPVGQARDTGRLNFDYRHTPADPLSFEGAVNMFGARPVSSKVFAVLGGKQPSSDPYATLDLGVRYRFTTAGHRSTLRLQALNVLDARKWMVATTGGLNINPPRRYFVSLATDF